MNEQVKNILNKIISKVDDYYIDDILSNEELRLLSDNTFHFYNKYVESLEKIITLQEKINALETGINGLKTNQYILIDYLKQIGISDQEIGDMLSKEVI